MAEDEFLTLKAPSEGYYMDSGSKFLAYAFPVTTEAEVNPLLQNVRKDHPKARHYCYAFRIVEGSLERINDDGEPSGSAGRPILGQLIRKNLMNIIIIVVRYFGGTKLGIPGLIEAYKTSASNAIEAGTIVSRKIFALVKIQMDYEQLPSLINYIRKKDIPLFKEEYAENASITVGFPKSKCKEELKKTLQDFSQMDFVEIEEYENYLHLKVQMQRDEEIV